jgi:hypothetical protein
VQTQIARAQFHKTDILYGQQFDLVDWEMVHGALHRVYVCFKYVCASKSWILSQLLMAIGHGKKMYDPFAPAVVKLRRPVHTSFLQITPAASRHWCILLTSWSTGWLRLTLILISVIVWWHMLEEEGGSQWPRCSGMDHRYRKVAEEQDAIGWRWFMEGMICHGLRGLQEVYNTVEGSNNTGEQWAAGVIIKLLETTHGQWLYHSIQVHDRISGIQATQQKEELQMAIEAQQDMGWEGLLEKDQYLVEVNLEGLEHISSERQEYWLVAIQAAQEASRIQGLSQMDVGRRRAAIRGHVHTQL